MLTDNLPPDLTPELVALLQERLRSMSDEELAAGDFQARAAIARENNTPEGFEHFYYCINGFELYPYAKNEWVPTMYDAKADNTGLLLEAFRGSGKSFFGATLDIFLLHKLSQRSESEIEETVVHEICHLLLCAMQQSNEQHNVEHNVELTTTMVSRLFIGLRNK